jgi:hypothetical protein
MIAMTVPTRAPRAPRATSAAVNAFNAARALAQERGWAFNWRLVELPGVGHNAPKMFSAPQASDALAP